MKSLDPTYARLLELWTWENRDAEYRVRFAEGDEFVLTKVVAGRDRDGPPHAAAAVKKTIHMSSGRSWDPEADMFFHLADLAEVRDSSGEIVFRAA